MRQARIGTWLVVAAMAALLATQVRAESEVRGHGGASAEHHAEVNYPHPEVPGQAVWAGAMLLTIFFMFVMAAFVGMLVRSEIPEEVPPAHSHDEPPGASHQHGTGGTRVVDPHD